MACEEIHTWTLSALVGAFVDLSIAYLLLCGSAISFFASKFLSFFGLLLPCPCNGLFSGNCIQKLLLDSPINKISSVQMSVKSKFPFDSILVQDNQRRHVNLQLLEGEACSSSESGDKREKMNELARFGSGLDDCKGKGVMNQRPRPGTLRRRRWPRQSSLSSDRASSVPLHPGEEDEHLHDNDNEIHADAGVISDEGMQHSFKWNDMMRESRKFEREDSSTASDFAPNVQRETGSDRSEVHTIRVLEQALEGEHAARAVLYRELEKERSAAATAADEAMAMILRIQKEKASTEMEARQYQRMIEEKSAYDAEEMSILKEILVRREREKHFLEKELEAYRQMLAPGNEEFGISSQRPRMSFESSEDPSLMLQQLSEYIDKKEKVRNMNKSSHYDAPSVEKHGRVLAFGEEPSSPRWDDIDDLLRRGDSRYPSIENHHLHGSKSIDEYNQEFQEKQLVSVEDHPSNAQGQSLVSEADSVHKLSGSREENLLEKTIVVDEEQVTNDNAAQCQGMAAMNDQVRETGISFPCDGAILEKHGSYVNQGGIDHHNSLLEAEPTVLDVHVIEDKSELCNQGSEIPFLSPLVDTATDRFENLDLQSEASSLRSLDILSDFPGTSRKETPSVICRSMSDMRSVLDKSQGKALLADMRRNSVSSVDYERLKLESEVGWLRERLKIVQEGREKLSFSVEHREREKMHLQLLEDIARQLREIRQLTEPVRSVRQASLPPTSSKLSSKKRRCRSVSWGIHGSN